MKFKYSPLIIILFGLFSHGLILLSDGVFWDDWLWYSSLVNRNYQPLYVAAFQRGIPTDYFFWLSYTVFPNILLGERILVFAFILGSALLVFGICQASGMLSQGESLMIALVSMTYPAFQTWLLISTSQYLFYYFLFLLAIWIFLNTRKLSKKLVIGLHILSLGFFYLSFSLNSLLVFYFGFLLFITILAYMASHSLREVLLRFFPRHLLYFVLPLIYWLVKATFFAPRGLYQNYNHFVSSPLQLISSFKAFIANAILNQPKLAFTELAAWPILAIFLVLFLGLLWAFKLPERISFTNSIRPIFVLLFGLILLTLSIFPYAAVGLFPGENGWSTRHAILVGLPIGIILAAVFRALFFNRRNALAWLGWACFVTLVFGFSVRIIDQYLNWEFRWIKDESVMTRLIENPVLKNYSIFWISDGFGQTESEDYRFYEWSSMFNKVWGGKEKWLGFPDNPHWKGFFQAGLSDQYRSYYYRNLDAHGCQANLIIQPGQQPLKRATTLGMYYYTQIFNPQDLSMFLDHLTNVVAQPIQSAEATDCK